MKGYVSLCLLVVATFLQAQDALIDSAKNVIINPENLLSFYQKLNDTQNGNSSIRVLHIGDSHIQAGFFTGALRKAFQQDYGSAGRGLVFPYRLANTNGHMDAQFSSDVAWQRYRIITDDAPKSGIAGATVYTDASQFTVQFRCDSTAEFNQIAILGQGLAQVKLAIPKESGKKITPQFTRKIHTVKSGDVLGKIARKYHVSIRQIKQWNRIKGTMIRIGQKLVITQRNKVPKYNPDNFEWIVPYEQTDSTLKAVLGQNVNEVYLIKEENKNSKRVSLYSWHLSNSQQGVTYDGVGYNGAKYIDYLNSPLFFKQLERLPQIDLVIVSLGTNEAFDKVYALDNFYADVMLFCEKLKQNTACQAVLLTTPPSALYKRKYPNEKLTDYTEVLKRIAQEQHCAVWDLFQIMKGKNGMKHWYRAGLAGKDRIHFRESGYDLQGQLLYDALMKYAE